MYLILPATLAPGVYSTYSRNEYQKEKNMFLGSRAWPVYKADNLTIICKLIINTVWDLNISQPYRPPWPVVGMALVLLYLLHLSIARSCYSRKYIVHEQPASTTTEFIMYVVYELVM
jgi:hypothetical protein